MPSAFDSALELNLDTPAAGCCVYWCFRQFWDAARCTSVQRRGHEHVLPREQLLVQRVGDDVVNFGILMPL